MNITEIFCDVDDFCKVFIPVWLSSLLTEGKRRRQRQFTMSPSEVMTILILFNNSNYRDFKHFYIDHVPCVWKKEFPKRVSYNRFVELAQSVLIPLCAYLHTRRVTSRGIAFVDSTPLRVCHNRRIPRHKTFAGLAQRGKNSVDWFYGFKLHLIIDDRGELVSFFISPGNLDDRNALRKMTKYLKGKLFGDKGYISQALKEFLWDNGIELITKLRRNMKPVILEDFDRILLRKRSLIETVHDQLKNISQLEHTRHRSIVGFMVNALCALIAYSWLPKKPSLNLRQHHGTAFLVVGADQRSFLSHSPAI